MVELAETAGAAVWDINNALNFPNKHPLCLSMDKASLRHTDLVLGLDVRDWEKPLTELDSTTRTLETLLPAACDFAEIGFGEVGISKWSMDYCRMQPVSVRALGDTALGIPQLTRICQERIAADPGLQAPHRGPQGQNRPAPRSGLGELAGGGAAELGCLTDHLLAPGARNLGRDQGRGLGADRQHTQAAGAQAVGFRQALSAPGRRARHRHPDRHLARGRARPQGRRPHRGGHPARRRPDVRCRRAVGGGEIPDSRCWW